MQNTLVRSVSFHGVGLHSGAPVTMVVHPADEDHGIWFRRTDLAANVLTFHRVAYDHLSVVRDMRFVQGV